MRKLLRIPSIKYLLLLAAAALLAANLAAAAGSVVQQGNPVSWANRYGRSISITYLATGDAADGSVPNFDIELTEIRGFFLYEIETVPGSGGDQPDAYTLAVQNSRATALVSLAARSTTANEVAIIEDGFPLMDTTPTLVIGDLGNSNTTTIVIKFVK